METERVVDDQTVAKNPMWFDLAKEIMRSEQEKPWARGHLVRTLFKNSDFKMVLISMEKGSILKEHRTDGTISIQVLKGSILFTAQGGDHSLEPNNVLLLGPSIEHKVEARDESVFLLTIA
jgi:quercetin dioxygenase-like cupin family protein